MKATIELLEIYHNALVDTIQYLDRINHSDTHLRHKVDVALNHSEFLTRKSNEEIKNYEKEIKRRISTRWQQASRNFGQSSPVPEGPAVRAPGG